MMKLIRAATAAAVLTLVAACGLTPVAPQTPRQAIVQLNTAYASAATLAKTYTSLPRCPQVTICSEQSVVDVIKLSDETAYRTVVVADEAATKLGSDPSRVAIAIAAAEASVKTFKVLADLHAKK